MAVCRCCRREHRRHWATLTWVFSDTSDSPSTHFQGKSYGKLKPTSWVRGATGHHTLPHPFFPFSPIHSPLLLRQARVGQGQPGSAQLPQAQEPGQVRALSSSSSHSPRCTPTTSLPGNPGGCEC